jgi:hypothetical protein
LADDVIRKVIGYLRQIEKLAEAGNLDGVLLEARLALRLCNAPSRSDTTSDAKA